MWHRVALITLAFGQDAPADPAPTDAPIDIATTDTQPMGTDKVIVTTRMMNDVTTGAMDTGTMMDTMINSTMMPMDDHTMMDVAFDPSNMWLKVNVGNCMIGDMSAKDVFDLFYTVNEFIKSECAITSTVEDAKDHEGVCTLHMTVEEANEAEVLKMCLMDANKEVMYMSNTYPIILPTEVMTNKPPSPLSNGELRQRLETGLDSSLLDDASVVHIVVDRTYADIQSSFDDTVSFLNDLIEKVQVMVTPNGASMMRSVEVVGMAEVPETGKTRVTIRPIASDSEMELETLNDLKTLIEDPNSALNQLAGIVPVTTTTTTTTTTSTTVTTTTEEETTDEGTDWPLVGGLVGGIGGALLVGGGATYYGVQRKKNKSDEVNTLVPEDNSPQVLTPNTKHGVEGILIERTPRANPY